MKHATRPKTLNRGADDGRAALMAYLRRCIAASPDDTERETFKFILIFLKGRSRRTTQKPGGLGRK